MIILRTLFLFVLTAIAEIVGCDLPSPHLRDGAPGWYLVPALVSLSLFAWLLTLHPTGAGRTYAAYGGVYVATAIAWMLMVEGRPPDRWDLVGASVSVVGMGIIFFAPR